MTRIAGNTVLVTGGARGIGRLFAEGALERGAAGVVLWDIDAEGLARTAAEFRAHGATVHTDVVDVSDPPAVSRAAEAAVALAGGPPGILLNNAGIVVGKPFAEHTTGEIERSIRINVLGVMHTTRAFLPAMRERRAGHIVNIASAVGLVPHPNMSVYASSKWAVVGWSESLRLEQERENIGIRVTTVCPSYVATGMFEGARAPLLTPILTPQRIVERMLAAVLADRILVREPAVVNLLPLLRGVLPTRWFDRIVGRGFGIYRSMDRWVGHDAPPAPEDRESSTTLGA